MLMEQTMNDANRHNRVQLDVSKEVCFLSVSLFAFSGIASNMKKSNLDVDILTGYVTVLA